MHRFKFYKMARTVQVSLASGADIANLSTLDKKFWLVLSCPAKVAGYDCAVGRVLDTDSDGRVRVPEVLAAIEWLKPRVADFDRLFVPVEGLSIDDICATSTEGKVLRQLFAKLAKEGILTEQSIDAAIAEFRQGVANGDGVIPTTAVDTKWVPVAESIIAVTGGTDAYDGTKGISLKDLDTFKGALEAYQGWRNATPQLTANFGGLSAAEAVALVTRLAPKVDEFFTACNLVRYNPAMRETLIAPVSADALAGALLALPAVNQGALDFEEGINPLYRAEMSQLAKVATALDPSVKGLTVAVWEMIRATVAPFVAWAALRPVGADVFTAMDEQMIAFSSDASVRECFIKVLAEDSANAALAEAFVELKKLLILRTKFLRFLRNFVNVTDLYSPTSKPLFLVGTLFMDGRACTLCFPIEQAAAAHATAAASSKCCLVYCTLKRFSAQAPRTICAVFTAGSVVNLAVGKNGLFFDLEGNDWEASVCHVIANPISLTEAFFTPWRKIGAAFTGVIHKFISGKNDAAVAGMSAKVTGAVTAPVAATPAPAGNGGAMMASVATLGIALSFIATAVTGVVASLTNTPFWKIGLAVTGIIFVVSIPSVILTWFKLRARDLAPVLNASGWAINRTIGLTPGLGKLFTQCAVYVGQRFICPPMKESHVKRALLLWLFFLAVAIAVAGWFFCPCSPRNRACQRIETSTDSGVVPAETNVAPTVEVHQ
ncbi:MAG: hypothetical protein RR982_06240 [Kiritimatiellia bacterium]